MLAFIFLGFSRDGSGSLCDFFSRCSRNAPLIHFFCALSARNLIEPKDPFGSRTTRACAHQRLLGGDRFPSARTQQDQCCQIPQQKAFQYLNSMRSNRSSLNQFCPKNVTLVNIMGLSVAGVAVSGSLRFHAFSRDRAEIQPLPEFCYMIGHGRASHVSCVQLQGHEF